MLHTHALPALVTLATLALLFFAALRVGKARGTYGIQAPATSGHEIFDRHFRVQMNTLENAVIFLPALWLAALYFSAWAAAALGVVWLAGRLWYLLAYPVDPKRRGGGFGLAFAAWGALMLLATWGVGRALLAGAA